jgi:hypothetical protein
MLWAYFDEAIIAEKRIGFGEFRREREVSAETAR